jgi:ligand-binding sensor domain-containing protein
MKLRIISNFTKTFFLFGALLLSNLLTKAEEPEFIPYIINDFDIHNQTWGISQNPNNHLVYLANSEGLVEFNGINWTKYTLKDRLPLRSVSVHSDGRIFTGSFEDFGFWQPNTKGELNYQSLSHLTEMEKNDEIWKIYIVDEKVYFQSFTSIYIYKNSNIEKVKAPYAMLFLHKIEKQFVVQVIDSGLYSFENNEFKFIENSKIFSNKKVHAIIPYGKGEWLVCTDNYGIYHFDGNRFNYFNSNASSFLKDNICNTAKQLNDSTFAFGSILNGLIISNKKGEILRSYNIYNGLKNNTILSLYADNEAGLWLGLDEGVAYIDLLSPFTHYKSRNASFGTIYAMLRKDNQLYIGTNHGLFIADIEKRGQFYHFKNIRLVHDSQGQVWSLGEYNNQILCGHNEGTFAVINDSLKLISSVTGGWVFTPFQEHLLVGTYTGIIVLEKSQDGNWQFLSKLENFTEPTRYIEVDYLGYIWASHHQKGIYKIEISEDLTHALKTNYFPNINGKSHNIKVFKINNRMIFTTGENIYTYDYVRNQIIPVDSLAQDLGEFKTANQIQYHQKNEYWLIKEDKLALFEINIDFTATKKCELQLNNISLPQRSIQLVNLDKNTLIIPTPESFDTYDLALNKSRQGMAQLEVNKVTFYGKQDAVTTHFNSFKDLKTSWNMNNVTIHFIAPYSFDFPSKQFLYRINELDSNWQSTHNNHFTYLGLKHGTYTAEVQGPDGSIIQVPFIVEKPWYSTSIAIAIYFIIFLLSVWLLIKYIQYKLMRQKELVAMELKQSSLEKELDYKNYELMLTIRYLINKNEILTELQKEINNIKVHSSKYPIKNLRSMETIINEGLETQTEEWMNAMQSLKLSQQGFFKNLLDHFPDLTTNDLRLCSYLRMNFSTKEIARLLNNSTRAVEISRYRLRKKLNLQHDNNLTEYLMSIDFTKID